MGITSSNTTPLKSTKYFPLYNPNKISWGRPHHCYLQFWWKVLFHLMQRNFVVLIPSARFGIQNARFKNFPFRTCGWNESFFVSLGSFLSLGFFLLTETFCHKTKKDLQSSFWLQKGEGLLVLCLEKISKSCLAAWCLHVSRARYH